MRRKIKIRKRMKSTIKIKSKTKATRRDESCS
jgi:hypothetical protein